MPVPLPQGMTREQFTDPYGSIVSSTNLPQGWDIFLRAVGSLLPGRLSYGTGSAVSPRGSALGLYPRSMFSKSDIGGSTSLYKLFDDMMRTVHAREGQLIVPRTKPVPQLKFSPESLRDISRGPESRGGITDVLGLFSAMGPTQISPADALWKRYISDVLSKAYYRGFNF